LRPSPGEPGLDQHRVRAGSQFAAISAVGAYFFFGERLRRIQIVGIAGIVVGVGMLAVLRV
jgi:multidrug transporter EmrE-like cation transporter